MKRYLAVIQSEQPSITEEDLTKSIRDTDITSMDLLAIRVALEKFFNHEISDEAWYKSETLSQGLEYFHNINPTISRSPATPTLEFLENLEIRMPQMANNALSENWLLKHLGDIHWMLLAKGFKKNTSNITDSSGTRLYATFLRIQYSMSSLKKFLENDCINFKSEIEGFGGHTYLTKVSGISNQNTIDATLITTFTFNENGDNTTIVKATPSPNTELIPRSSQKPLFLNDYRLLRKNLLETYYCLYGSFTFESENIFECEYDINPFIDINGVGLLYFASYPAIADKCTHNYFKNQKSEVKFGEDCHTIFRDVFYFANMSRNDTILFKLDNFVFEKTLMKISCSLYRKSDSQILARIFTVKEISN